MTTVFMCFVSSIEKLCVCLAGWTLCLSSQILPPRAVHYQVNSATRKDHCGISRQYCCLQATRVQPWINLGTLLALSSEQQRKSKTKRKQHTTNQVSDFPEIQRLCSRLTHHLCPPGLLPALSHLYMSLGSAGSPLPFLSPDSHDALPGHLTDRLRLQCMFLSIL